MMKFSNYARILQVIDAHPDICRKDVAAQLGLSPQTLTNLVKDLDSFGFVTERHLAVNGKGRAPVGLAINRSRFVLVTIILGTGRLCVCLHSAAGKVYFTTEYHISAGDPIIDLMKTSVRTAFDLASQQSLQVFAMVMSAEGIVDEHHGILTYGKAYGWDKMNLRKELSEFPIPFFLVDDVNIICDYLNGQGIAPVSNYLVVKLDSGIGCSVTYNGKTLVSNDSTLGKLGHLKVHDTQEHVTCWCGNEDCLTAFISRDALEKRYGIPYENVVENMRLESGKGGDFVPTYVRYLSPILANAISLLGIERVYLTGLVPETLGMDFAHQIEKEMANSIPPWVHFHGVEVLPKISDLVLVSSFFLHFFFGRMMDYLSLCKTSPFQEA